MTIYHREPQLAGWERPRPSRLCSQMAASNSQLWIGAPLGNFGSRLPPQYSTHHLFATRQVLLSDPPTNLTDAAAPEDDQTPSPRRGSCRTCEQPNIAVCRLTPSDPLSWPPRGLVPFMAPASSWVVPCQQVGYSRTPPRRLPETIDPTRGTARARDLNTLFQHTMPAYGLPEFRSE